MGIAEELTPRTRGRRIGVAVAALALTSAGCGAETSSVGTAPVQDDEDTTSVEGTLCQEVTEAELTSWTGRLQSLGPAVIQGPLTDCLTDFDEAGMIIEWGFSSDVDSFALAGRRADYPGLGRTRVSLGPGTPAWLLTGTIAGTNTARVVTFVDGRRLIVDANDRGGVAGVVGTSDLAEAARAVAVDYVR